MPCINGCFGVCFHNPMHARLLLPSVGTTVFQSSGCMAVAMSSAYRPTGTVRASARPSTYWADPDSSSITRYILQTHGIAVPCGLPLFHLGFPGLRHQGPLHHVVARAFRSRTLNQHRPPTQGKSAATVAPIPRSGFVGIRSQHRRPMHFHWPLGSDWCHMRFGDAKPIDVS